MIGNGRRDGWGLVELLVVVLILVGLAIWLAPRYLGTGKKAPGSTQAPAPIERARGVDCANNLRQIRYAITMAQQSDERSPASLNELRLPGSVVVCPVSKQPYTYDPGSGRAHCSYPGHTAF